MSQAAPLGFARMRARTFFELSGCRWPSRLRTWMTLPFLVMASLLLAQSSEIGGWASPDKSGALGLFDRFEGACSSVWCVASC